jgi:hypothetical protein
VFSQLFAGGYASGLTFGCRAGSEIHGEKKVPAVGRRGIRRCCGMSGNEENNDALEA